MIIARAPVRLSFLGGGTDYPDHFRAHGGRTLGATIDKYSYVTVKRLAPLFDYSIRVNYSRTELVNDVDQVEHPAVRECLRLLRIPKHIEISYVGDLPARTGLGSSSSFTVAMLHALHAFRGEMASHTQLAEEAVHVEHELIKERVGVQDQYTCAHGGVVSLRIAPDATVDVTRVPLRRERLRDLSDRLLLFYTGVRRHAHEIVGEQLERTRQGALSASLGRLAVLAEQGLEVLAGEGPLDPFGELLHEAWGLKRTLSSRIATAAIDAAYDRARAAGALGGKLLGAGGGGFLLVFSPPGARDAIRAGLADLKEVGFSLEREGSRLIFYEP